MKNISEKIKEYEETLLFYIKQIANAEEMTEAQVEVIFKYCNKFLKLNKKAQK